MTPAEGISKLGFRRWYERELIDGHVYLVTCILSLILVAVCLDRLDWRGPLVEFVFEFAALILGGVLCFESVRRYGFLLARAECFGEQSSCAKCKTYGVLRVVGAGQVTVTCSLLERADNPWLRVQCKRCGHEWLMENLK